MTLRVEPCTLAEANFIVGLLHRNHKPATGHRFSLSCYNDDQLCAVVICGRPVARMSDQRYTLEITRCASDGTMNAISKLYGAVVRASRAMGYKRVQTFTLPEEGGASLKASGFTFEGEVGGGEWARPSRTRSQAERPDVKWKWGMVLC